MLIAFAGAASLAVFAVGYARIRLLLVTVDGRSMEPTLYPGDRLLVRRRSLRGLRCGDVVVLGLPSGRRGAASTWREPVNGRAVKRVAALPGQRVPDGVPCASPVVPAGTVVVLSDNIHVGVDSRDWGPYPGTGVVGVVVRRIDRRDSDELHHETR